MSLYPEAIDNLISHLKKLPGIGKKTAERLALDMVYWPENELSGFADTVRLLKSKLKFCVKCGNFASGELCDICRGSSRESSRICVIEQPTQISVMEQNGVYRGLYHVLGGKLKPLDGIGPSELNVTALIERAKSEQIEEVIIALSFDVEGEATASYLVEELKPYVNVSRLATGIPLGTDISCADSGTLSAALSRRYRL